MRVQGGTGDGSICNKDQGPLGPGRWDLRKTGASVPHPGGLRPASHLPDPRPASSREKKRDQNGENSETDKIWEGFLNWKGLHFLGGVRFPFP